MTSNTALKEIDNKMSLKVKDYFPEFENIPTI
jgi:hypothetical protein